ncbi:MAG: bifunctional 4-hydroxy-3-methylbut-2-enyl diphosphate reductase/30S ribosomal protein S1 [Oscillospiraceae bacterium]|nr:bifunctional 4-hydroxy-3-methylbut-2-enyl diphosphate reductase/30S ribosomal protein S1 [Oscillospiraceae bacterium]MDY3258700.1 bifunctional 4-hydroxy-3-methylbut-2-enyl diphosphate reductase/30S ribosomal protein S1 [Ruminococcus callidus]
MAKITVAESAGFCFGVDRAVKLVYKTLEKEDKVSTLGPIIHNTDVVNDMVSKGAKIINSVDEVEDNEVVIIRSHGVGKKVFDSIKAKGNKVVDATCPFVSRIHKIVSEKTEEGYFILIAGDKNHPEVSGIVGYCENNCFIFKDDVELFDFLKKNLKNFQKPIAIVAQTTYNIIIWDRCLKLIHEMLPQAVVYDTICSATQRRQDDAEKLSLESDLMIVVGGRHSSNTVKLYDVCRKNCPTYHIERADELRCLNLYNADKIGITAGASTPAHIIKEVKNTMTEILNKENSTEDIDFAEALEKSFKKIHNGERVKGCVVKVNDTDVIVDVGTKHTGYVSLSELTNDTTKKPSDIVKEGDELDLVVIKINDQDGIVTLSKKRVDEQIGFEKIIKAKEDKAILEGKVQRTVNGGVIANYEGVRVFIPASLTGLPRGAKLDTLVGQDVKFEIIEVTENRRRAVGSMKAIVKAQQQAAREKFWAEAEVGKVYKGEVKSITNYGAFVDLGGIDGMVHISELSWKRINHPTEVVKVGDVIEVYIKELDKENNRISLGYKKAEDNPWEKFKNSYKVGDVIDAKIVSITPFGAFAQIIDGVDGLIHISQLADKHVQNVKDIVAIGDVVKVKIIDIDIENKRISISMRALLEDNDEAADEAEDAE